MKGKVIKGVGGFYYVDTDEGVIECRARGKFRIENISPLVGDVVEIENNYIYDIYDRKNCLIRPKVANVDKAVITFAAAKPSINFEILDKFLILAAAENVESVICINKVDLAKGDIISEIHNVYRKCGAEIIEVSTVTQVGADRIRECLSGVTSVFAGPSGVGKSSVINMITGGSVLKTGELSRKISRGRHTTRETVLISLEGGGYVVDTPGFTSLSLEHIKAEDLHLYFKEFEDYSADCKYSSCAHLNERTEDCAVKSQVGINIHQKRYDCFCRIYGELSR